MLDAVTSAFLTALATTTILPSYSIDIDQIDGWLRVTGEIIAVVSAVAWLRARADRRQKASQEAQEARIIASVEKRTQPIQPKYRNDGESLADIANKVKRLEEIVSEQTVVLTSVHKNVTESSVELALHRAAVATQFADLRSERSKIVADGDARADEWRTALQAQGITVPPDEPV